MGKIVSIVYQPHATDVSDKRFCRVPVDEAMIIKGHGIEGDHKAGRNPKRHLNIMMRETLDTLVEGGFSTAPGEMGEQLQIQGLEIEKIAEGTLVKLGEQVIVRLNKLRVGCIWLEQIQGQPVSQTSGLLGRMATAMEGGIVRVGDDVSVLADSNQHLVETDSKPATS